MAQLVKNPPAKKKKKESTCNVEDLGLIPGLGRSPGEGKVYPFQYSGLENSLDCIAYGVAKSRTQLGDFHFSLRDVSMSKFGPRMGRFSIGHRDFAGNECEFSDTIHVKNTHRDLLGDPVAKILHSKDRGPGFDP